jgi:hypothetical protein
VRNPYNPGLVFAVLMNMGFGSLNAGLAIMSAGEDTGDMLFAGSAAAASLAYLLYVSYILNKHQQKVVVA